MANALADAIKATNLNGPSMASLSTLGDDRLTGEKKKMPVLLNGNYVKPSPNHGPNVLAQCADAALTAL
eukprot:1369326-Amphidinium_carterae.1